MMHIHGHIQKDMGRIIWEICNEVLSLADNLILLRVESTANFVACRVSNAYHGNDTRQLMANHMEDFIGVRPAGLLLENAT